MAYHLESCLFRHRCFVVVLAGYAAAEPGPPAAIFVAALAVHVAAAPEHHVEHVVAALAVHVAVAFAHYAVLFVAPFVANAVAPGLAPVEHVAVAFAHYAAPVVAPSARFAEPFVVPGLAPVEHVVVAFALYAALFVVPFAHCVVAVPAHYVAEWPEHPFVHVADPGLRDLPDHVVDAFAPSAVGSLRGYHLLADFAAQFHSSFPALPVHYCCDYKPRHDRHSIGYCLGQ